MSIAAIMVIIPTAILLWFTIGSVISSVFMNACGMKCASASYGVYILLTYIC